MESHHHVGVIGITWLKRSHTVPHFNCLNLRVSLMMLLWWLDTNASAYGIKELKKSYIISVVFYCLDTRNAVVPFLYHWHHVMPTPVPVLHLIWLSWLNKCSSATDDAIGITWCWCWCQWHHMTKISYFIFFWSSWPNKWNGAIGDTVGIMWHWHQH